MRRLLPVAGLILGLFFAVRAEAGAPVDPSAEARVASREKAAKGLELFDAGRWKEAYQSFQEAEAFYHVPTLVLMMAQCERNVGRLVSARALYQKLISETLPPSATPVFRRAQATAQVELSDLETRIPHVTVTLSGPGAESAKLTVDGAAISTEPGEIELDPGTHRFVADAADKGHGEVTVTLVDGERRKIEIAMAPRSTRVVPAPASGQMSFVPAGVAFGVGGAALAAGAVTGLLAMGKSDAIRGRCQTVGGALHCLASDREERDAAQTLAVTSTVAFAVAGAGLLTGAVLTVVRARRSPGRGGAPAAAISFGPGSVLIGGSF